MSIIYLACLIFGGILVLFSLFTGGTAHDVDSVDVHHIDFDHLDTSHHIEINKDISAKSISSSDISKLYEIGKIFSFRNILYFITFFGLSGTLGDFFRFNNSTKLISSIIIGLFASIFGYSFMNYLKKSESGKTKEYTELIGSKGIVTLPFSKDRKGKILIETSGSTIEIIAKLSSISKIEEIRKGDKILLIEFDDNIAIVDKYDL